MTHYFNVCDINGADVAPVDVITFGSPCQDLSIAGKRAGLDGERSGLFMEAVRIIKEMRSADKLRNQWLPDTKNRNGSNADSESGTARERGNDSIRTANASSTDSTKGGTTNIEKPITQYGFCSTDNLRPRFAVWENVPGAFSSQKGEDFRVVLEELAKIKDPAVSIPKPPNGKWLNAGQIVGNGWSIAWRVLDAQFWGVPQRRRRIFLVADFGGESAPEILFKPESVSGHFAESRAQRKRTAGDIEGGVRAAGFKWGQGAQARSIGWSEEVSPTLPADAGGNTDPAILAYSFDSLSSNSMKSSNPHSGCREVDVAKCLDTTDPNPSKNQGGVAVVQPTYCLQGNGIDRADTAGCNGKGWTEDVCYTLNTIDRPAVYSQDAYDKLTEPEQSATLRAKGGNYGGGTENLCATNMTVRRLTPTECARLQGFPDEWGKLSTIAEMSDEDYQFWTECRKVKATIDGKKFQPKTKEQTIKWYNKLHTDSAEYKMWGNGVALPCVKFVMQGIAKQGAKTMASLFDGSGGFPLASILAGITPLWVSEIEPYCVAITKERFREVNNPPLSATGA